MSSSLFVCEPDWTVGLDKVWVHFHCQAGKSRTGIFMVIYDMIKTRFSAAMRLTPAMVFAKLETVTGLFPAAAFHTKKPTRRMVFI